MVQIQLLLHKAVLTDMRFRTAKPTDGFVSSGVHVGKVCWLDVMREWILLRSSGKVAESVLS